MPCSAMTDAEAAFLNRLQHATLSISLHALRRAPHLSPVALNILAKRDDLLWAVTLPEEITLPLADLWDAAIRHNHRQAQSLVHLLRFMPELASHFTPRQLAQYDSDLERLTELAGHPDPEVIRALLDHPALFPWSAPPSLRPPPWEASPQQGWHDLAFDIRPTVDQWRRLATRLLSNPALATLHPGPLLRWLFSLPAPLDLTPLLAQRPLRLATAGYWLTPPALRSALLRDALATQDLELLGALLLSGRLQEHEQAAVLKVVPLDLRAQALRFGTVKLPLLEALADDPDFTRELLDPDGSGFLGYHVDDQRSSERLEFTLLTRFGLKISWAVT